MQRHLSTDYAAKNKDAHCIILAAGIASPPIAPYTNYMPKCCLPVAGKPILYHTHSIHHSTSSQIQSFREFGVKKFTVVTGAHAAYFNDERVKAELDTLVSNDSKKSSIEFVENKDFWQMGPVQSLKCGVDHVLAKEGDSLKSVYICYGDAIFTDVAIKRVAECEAKNAVVVDRDARFVKEPESGKVDFNENSLISPGFTQSNAKLELCSVLKESGASDFVVDKISRDFNASEMNQVFGEFVGLIKLESDVLKSAMCENTPADDKESESYAPGPRTSYPLSTPKNQQMPTHIPKFLEKVQTLISKESDSNSPSQKTVELTALPIYGNWRELHTASDLSKANAELHYLSNQRGRREYIKQIGRRLLAEANDLKRPMQIVADELNLDKSLFDELMNGNVELKMAQDLLMKVNQNYPVSLNALWVEPDDTALGVRTSRESESEASRRVLSRVDRHGNRTPYYEYRDVAMSRLGPFRPEWIQELRTVDNNDPCNPDVAYNNGHLLFQSTFFLGPVNFYYDLGEGRGGKVCKELNTGDSNWISPFVPHSFTSRGKEGEFACIIACTYGAQIITGLQSLGELSKQIVNKADNEKSSVEETQKVLNDPLAQFSGDMRNPSSVWTAVLNRFMESDFLTLDTLKDEVTSLFAKRIFPRFSSSSSSNSSAEQVKEQNSDLNRVSLDVDAVNNNNPPNHNNNNLTVNKSYVSCNDGSKNNTDNSVINNSKIYENSAISEEAKAAGI